MVTLYILLDEVILYFLFFVLLDGFVGKYEIIHPEFFLFHPLLSICVFPKKIASFFSHK